MFQPEESEAGGELCHWIPGEACLPGLSGDAEARALATTFNVGPLSRHTAPLGSFENDLSSSVAVLEGA